MKSLTFRYALLAAGLQLTAMVPGNSALARDMQARDMQTMDCIVEPEMTIELSSAINGVVDNVAVDKSDRIATGQVLAKLESSVEQAQVALARTRAAMEEEIQAKRVQRDLSRSKKDRLLELYHKKTIPGFEKDEAEAEAALAELELKRAYSNQKLAKLELERAVADLQLRSLLSPIDGIVVDRYVHPGESVKDRPLLKLAQIDPMRVEVIADSELFGMIEKGMAAEIVIEGPTETRHQAQVSLVDGVVDAASGTFGIRLNLPNPQNEVIGGLKCRALFDLKTDTEAPTL